MILPGKHLKRDRALLGVGGEILEALKYDQTVSELWEKIQLNRPEKVMPLPFDWFVLALSFLFAVGAISFDRGVIKLGDE